MRNPFGILARVLAHPGTLITGFLLFFSPGSATAIRRPNQKSAEENANRLALHTDFQPPVAVAIANGADPRSYDSFGRNALGAALTDNRLDDATALIEADPELLKRATGANALEYPSPWFTAIKKGRLAAVKLLYERREQYDVDIYQREIMLSGEPADALSYAVREHQLAIVKFFITQTNLLTHQRQYTAMVRSCVWVAAYGQDEDALRLLKELGVDFDNLSDVRHPPAMTLNILNAMVEAIKKEKTTELSNLTIAFRLLLKHGADVNLSIEGITILNSAADQNVSQAVQALLELGADMYLPGPDGKLPIERAIENQNADMVALFCKNQYDINRPNPTTGKSPDDLISELDENVDKDFLSALEKNPITKKPFHLFHRKEIDAEIKDKRFTLHYIFSPTHAPILEKIRTQPDLLEAYIDAALTEDGAEPTARDLLGRTALGNAIHYNNLHGVVILLRRFPELLNIPTDLGNSLPWFFAIKKGNFPVVEFFVRNKERIDLDIYQTRYEINEAKVDAIGYACSFKQPIIIDIVRFLLTETDMLAHSRQNEHAHWLTSYVFIAAFERNENLLALFRDLKINFDYIANTQPPPTIGALLTATNNLEKGNHNVFSRTITAVRLLIQYGASPNSLLDSDSLLHIAVHTQLSQAVAILLDAGANMYHANSNGALPIEQAVKNRNAGIIALFCKNQYDINKPNPTTGTSLVVLMSELDWDAERDFVSELEENPLTEKLLELLKKNYAEVNDKQFAVHHIFTITNPEIKTKPDMLEAYIEEQIKKGANPLARDYLGRTALGNAIYYDNLYGVEILTRKFPTLINIPTNLENLLPWFYAIQKNKLDSVKFFVRYKNRLGLDIYQNGIIVMEQKSNALSYASELSHDDIVEFLITHTKEDARWRAYYILVTALNQDKTLLALFRRLKVNFNGAVNDPSSSGSPLGTLLIGMARKTVQSRADAFTQSLSAFELLLQYGASANSPMKKYSPLSYATEKNLSIAVGALLAHGANMYLPDSDGRLPVEGAVQNRNVDIIALFDEHGYDFKRPNPATGNSLLDLLSETDTTFRTKLAAKLAPKPTTSKTDSDYQTLGGALALALGGFAFVAFVIKNRKRNSVPNNPQEEPTPTRRHRDTHRRTADDLPIATISAVSDALNSTTPPDIHSTSEKEKEEKIADGRATARRTTAEIRAQLEADAKKREEAREQAEAHKKQEREIAEAHRHANSAVVRQQKETRKQKEEREKAEKKARIINIPVRAGDPTHAKYVSEYAKAFSTITIAASEHKKLDEHIVYLARLYNLLRTYLAIAECKKDVGVQDDLSIVATDLRNMLAHLAMDMNAQQNFEDNLSSLKDDIEKDCGQLKTRVARAALRDNPVFRTLSNTAKAHNNNDLVNKNDSENAEIQDDDIYIKWVSEKIIPTINRIAQPLLSAKRQGKNIAASYQSRIDALKMLMLMVGEQTNSQRKKRLKEMGYSWDFTQFTSRCHEARIKVAHKFPDTTTDEIVELAKLAIKINGEKASNGDLQQPYTIRATQITAVTALEKAAAPPPVPAAAAVDEAERKDESKKSGMRPNK